MRFQDAMTFDSEEVIRKLLEEQKMGVDVIWSQLVEFDRAGVTLSWLAMNIFHVVRGDGGESQAA